LNGSGRGWDLRRSLRSGGRRPGREAISKRHNEEQAKDEKTQRLQETFRRPNGRAFAGRQNLGRRGLHKGRVDVPDTATKSPDEGAITQDVHHTGHAAGE
jgi:hypothetical protein